MATNYTFGENILRAIQIQDELKQRTDAMKQEQMRFNANYAQRDRQNAFENNLAIGKFQAEADKAKFNVQKETYDQQKDFLDKFTRKQDVPTDVASLIKPEDYFSGAALKSQGWNLPPGFENGDYVPKTTETDKEQQLARDRQAAKDANDLAHQKVTESLSAGNLKVAQDRLAFDKIKAQKKDNDNYDKYYADTKSDVVALKTLHKDDKFEGASIEYTKYKSSAIANADLLLAQTGIQANTMLKEVSTQLPKDIPANTKVLDFIRGLFEPTDTPEDKRKIINNAVYKLGLNDKQIEALKLWGDAGTY